MSESDPSSPGARSQSDEDDADGPPDAEVEEDDESATRDADGDRTFWVFYQKKFYEVPADCVKADYGQPLPAKDGPAMGIIHECKSLSLWLKAGAKPMHLVVLEADIGGGNLQRGLYVTFCVRGQHSDDPFVLRPLHKSISKKFYETWTTGDDKWDESMRDKYAKLIEQEPPDSKQISPVSCHWKEVPKAEEPNVLYRRKPSAKKDDDDDDESPQATKKQKKQPSAAVSDDDGSHPESSSTLARQPSFSMPSTQTGVGGSTSSAQPTVNVFANTPGMVTVDLAEWRKLNAFYYTNGGGR